VKLGVQYRLWFGWLEGLLGARADSYLDGSAYHLDVVDWATKPTEESFR
jgi:hypothetical protein